MNHGAPAWGVIQPSDVITAIDGVTIANDLSVASDYGARLGGTSLLSEKQAGDEVSVGILRNGERLEKSIRLHPWRPFVPGLNTSDAARYRIFGGFVFRSLTADYLTVDPENADVGLVSLFRDQNLRTPERAEALILSHVLPAEASRGYFDQFDEIITRVQGRTPRDLADLNAIIDSATGRWLEIETVSGHRYVLDLEQSRRTTPEILERFAIGADRSPQGETMVVEVGGAVWTGTAELPAAIDDASDLQ